MRRCRRNLAWILIIALCVSTIVVSERHNVPVVKADETSQENPYAQLENGVLKIQGLEEITKEILVGIDLQEVQRIEFGPCVKIIAKETFQDCKKLEMIMWGDVETIGSYAFAGCENLDMMQIGSSITSIGIGAFWGCDKIDVVALPQIEKIGKNAFPLETSIVWGSSAQYNTIGAGFWQQRTGTMFVDDSAFWDSVIEENSQEKMRWEKFESSEDIIRFWKSTETAQVETAEVETDEAIGYYVHLMQKNVWRLEGEGTLTMESARGIGVMPDAIPETAVKHLVIKGEDVMLRTGFASRYQYLQSVKVFGRVAIQGEAFFKCEALEKFEAEKIKVIGEKGFYRCSSLKKIIMINGVTSIGESAFEGCTNLSEVVIEKRVTSIEKKAFYGCKKLENVELPPWTRKIEREAFGNCPSLKSVILSENVSQVGLGNFESTDIYWKGSEVEFETPERGESGFFETVSGTMYIPSGSAFWQTMREQYPDVHWKEWTPTPVIEQPETETCDLMEQVAFPDNPDAVPVDSYVDEEGVPCIRIGFTEKYQRAAFRLPKNINPQDYATVSIKAKVGGQLMFDLFKVNCEVSKGFIETGFLGETSFPFYYPGEEGETKYGTEEFELKCGSDEPATYIAIGTCRDAEDVEAYGRKYEFYIYSVTLNPVSADHKRLVFECNASPKSSQAPTTQPSESSSSPTKEPFPTASFSPAQEPLENPANPADASMTSPTQKTEKTATNIPSLSLKKKKSGKLRYIQVTIKSSAGRYFDLYMKKKGKKYTRVRLKKTTLKKGRQVVKLIYAKKSGTVYFKVRPYDVSKGRKRYGAYSKEKWVKW